MTKIVIVDKHGVLSTVNIKDTNKDNLYKKCNLRKNDGFESKTTWKTSVGGVRHHVELWAKQNGRANSENKYDFPPPCDNDLFFGACFLVKVNNDDSGCIEDLDNDIWLKIYEKLFGGFEDLKDNETESEDELEAVPSHLKTSDGYLKDGFIVDSTSDNDPNSNNEENSDAASHPSESESDNENSELDEELYSYTSDEN